MNDLFNIDDLPVQESGPIPLDSWWPHYPKRRRVAKKKVQAKWEKLSQHEQQSVFEDIVTNARGDSDPAWIKDSGEFVPMPMTYLNGGRWADEWEPAVNQSRFEDDFAKFVASDEPEERPVIGYDPSGAEIYGD